MALPFFLNIEQVLDILISEVPNGVFAQDRADDPDPDKRSYSSSELRAAAQMFSDLYLNLEDIYENKFVSTLQDDGLTSWEKDLFKTAQDASLPISTRKQNVLAKFRATGAINLPAIASIISGILTPLGLGFQILPYCGQSNGNINGAWIFGVSPLGVSTWLAELDPLQGTGLNPGETPLDCNLDYVAAGLTLSQLQAIQATAYTYEVQIFGNADSMTLALLDKTLTEVEPARSTHIITNNVTPPP